MMRNSAKFPVLVANENSIPNLLNEPTTSQFAHISFTSGNSGNEISLLEPEAGSDTFNSQEVLNDCTFSVFLLYKYAKGLLNLLENCTEFTKEELKMIETVNVNEIHSTFSSLPPHLMPSYYLFRIGQIEEQMKENHRVSLYFLFTSISHLMANDTDSSYSVLRALIKSAYYRILRGKYLKSSEWDFLAAYLETNLGIPKISFGGKKYNLCYDISTVSFIYNEMKFGKSEEGKSFFAQVWEACKRSSYRGRKKYQSKVIQTLIIPFQAEKRQKTFEKSARKLYQLEYTKLLFKPLGTMSHLLKEYEQLKLEFKLIDTDFRCRIFNRKDFELLKKSLESLALLANDFSNDFLLKKSFFFELDGFINFKCLLFAHDFCKELKGSDGLELDWASYRKTFETIGEILSISKSINVKFGHCSFQDIVCKILKLFHGEFFSLESIIKAILSCLNPQLASPPREEIDKVYRYLSTTDYFEQNLGYLEMNMSRFQIAEFIFELDEILAGAKCLHIFLDKKYQLLHELLATGEKETFRMNSVCFKRQYLQHFRTFLVLYNQ